jgi:hypothetical protein
MREQFVDGVEHSFFVGVIFFVFFLFDVMDCDGVVSFSLWLLLLLLLLLNHVQILILILPRMTRRTSPLRQRNLLRLQSRPNKLIFRRRMRPKHAPNDGESAGHPSFQINHPICAHGGRGDFATEFGDVDF